jgi:hypothetical protein
MTGWEMNGLNGDLHFRLLVRTAEDDVGGGVYLHW